MTEPSEADRDEQGRGADPAGEAREIAQLTARKVRDARDLARSIDSPYLIVMLLVYLSAAVSGSLVVLWSPFRDWYMFLAMYAVIFAFLLLYIKAHYRRRPFVQGITLAFLLLLTAFWIAVLHDRIPARRVWYGGEIVHREPVTALWLSIWLLAAVMLLLMSHFLVVGRIRRGAKSG